MKREIKRSRKLNRFEILRLIELVKSEKIRLKKKSRKYRGVLLISEKFSVIASEKEKAFKILKKIISTLNKLNSLERKLKRELAMNSDLHGRLLFNYFFYGSDEKIRA